MSFDFGPTPAPSKTPLINAVDIAPLYPISASPDATAPANPLVTNPKLDNSGTPPTPSIPLPSNTITANAFIVSQSAIIGLVLGILVFVLIFVSFIHVLLIKRRKREDNEKVDEEVGSDSGPGGRDSDVVSLPPPVYSPRESGTGEIPIMVPNDGPEVNTEQITAVYESLVEQGTQERPAYQRRKKFGKIFFATRKETPSPVRSLRVLV
ncbi:hypothetical protein TWF694_007228 [Orbilia ellipsospora]|uniref:Transmembrane protein n=1 Tax=Orbilia ellipsospora TaxID=2528407 RepID=A0AAV9XIR1_9PEZI